MWPTHYIPYQEKVEGTPPPRYYLTSLPYPIEVVEGIAASSNNPRLGFTPVATAEEEFQSNGAAISGLIRSILVTTSVVPDDIESNGSVISGVLNERLIRIDAKNDNIETSGSPISGILRDPLVVYENWPLGFDFEDLQSAGSPVSGALT